MKIKSLRVKILLTMTTAMIVSMVISSIITIRLQREQLVKHYEDYQQGMLQLVMNGIIISMERNRPKETQQMLDGFQKHEDISSIRIISLHGEILYSTNSNERGNKLPEKTVKTWGDSRDRNIYNESREESKHTLTMIQKIENLPSCQRCHESAKPYLGFLSIINDIAEIDEDVSINRRNNILMALSTLILIATVITLVHLRFVQRGLGKVLNAISEVERGNFQTHIDVPTTDEMGRLAVAFNRMIDHLNQARKELKQMHKKQLERADKLASVGELAAGMAHEIKNPVAGISNAMKVILNDMDVNNPDRPIFEEILRQIHRVDRAVNSLLSYARPRLPSFKPSNLTEIITKSLKLAYQQAGAAKIDVKHVGDMNIPALIMDPLQIEQVLVNLLMNAVQSMPNGGILEVEQILNTVDGQVEIKIRDSGTGIDPENLKQIFKPFFTTKHKGTGLGLAICQDIIKRHGGSIGAESSVGEGSIFTIILPLTGPDNKN